MFQKKKSIIYLQLEFIQETDFVTTVECDLVYFCKLNFIFYAKNIEMLIYTY